MVDESHPAQHAAAPAALDLRDHVAFDASSASVNTVTRARDLALAVICLEPRQVLPAQTHVVDRLYTVIGGRAYAVVEDAEITLEPLQGVLVPAGAAHGIRNDSADPLILQLVTGPSGAAAEAETGGGAATGAVPGAVGAVGDGPPGDHGADPAGEAAAGDRFARIRRLLGSR